LARCSPARQQEIADLLDDLCDRLVGSLATGPQQDDMCVLAVCRTP
jgi:hypothetical protein